MAAYFDAAADAATRCVAAGAALWADEVDRGQTRDPGLDFNVALQDPDRALIFCFQGGRSTTRGGLSPNKRSSRRLILWLAPRRCSSSIRGSVVRTLIVYSETRSSTEVCEKTPTLRKRRSPARGNPRSGTAAQGPPPHAKLARHVRDGAPGPELPIPIKKAERKVGLRLQ